MIVCNNCKSENWRRDIIIPQTQEQNYVCLDCGLVFDNRKRIKSNWKE